MSGSPPSDRPPAERAAAALDAREAARAGRRDALLAAAEAVFAESGFAGAKMAEIAARAGYSAGHLYNVFESKEALFAELLVRRGGALVARIEAALLGAGGARGGLERLVEAVLRAVEEQRAFFVMLTEVTPNLEWAGPREEGRALRERLESLVRDW